MEKERNYQNFLGTSIISKSSIRCFSSMKISSAKSLFSPSRTDRLREPSLSLSSSLRRRLRRSNGSIRGSQSPMFSGKKRGGSEFEVSEPSSPKVTCIGQVRVKTKMHRRKKTAIGSRSNSTRNQKWIHFPMTICEAIRDFGAGFACLIPCNKPSSCSYSRRRSGKRIRNLCGSVFGKWLSVSQEKEEKEEKENDDVTSVVDENERTDETEAAKEDSLNVRFPPRNALLLMRCRSEPLRMDSCLTRFWESPALKETEDDDDDEQLKQPYQQEDVKSEEDRFSSWLSNIIIELVQNLQKLAEEDANDERECIQLKQERCQHGLEIYEQSRLSSCRKNELMEEKDDGKLHKRGNFDTEEEREVREHPPEKNEEKIEAHVKIPQTPPKTEEGGEEIRKLNHVKPEENLPECLLLMMMYEPKLSMEVSKETWVRRSDFKREERRRMSVDSNPGQRQRINVDTNLSQSRNPPPSIAAVVEQKLVSTHGGSSRRRKPLILTRCKSEPVRPSAKLAPEAVFWKGNKGKNHPPIAFGFTAARISS